MGRSLSDREWLDLGVRLRARRTELSLTREALARSAQLSATRLGAVERGDTAISAVELRRVAQALKTPVGAFLQERPAELSSPLVIIYDALARTDEGAALAEAFVRIRTPRLRRHVAKLAQELAAEEEATP